jgi:hypothetical protein
LKKLTGLSKQKNLKNSLGNRCGIIKCKYREFCIEFMNENIINNKINETKKYAAIA